mmetsp:Transcript_35830/g.98744  ORF Transcript_35830/g.98744 Transcript_35830/m.98744 type:complete len:242 (+) Transcript_35830:1192-1917(+)
MGFGFLIYFVSFRICGPIELLRRQCDAGSDGHVRCGGTVASGGPPTVPLHCSKLGPMGRGWHGEGRHESVRAGSEGGRHATAHQDGSSVPRGGTAHGHATPATSGAVLRLRRGLAAFSVGRLANPRPGHRPQGQGTCVRSCPAVRQGSCRRRERHRGVYRAEHEGRKLEAYPGEDVQSAWARLAGGRAGQELVQQGLRRECTAQRVCRHEQEGLRRRGCARQAGRRQREIAVDQWRRRDKA